MGTLFFFLLQVEESPSSFCAPVQINTYECRISGAAILHISNYIFWVIFFFRESL